MSEIDFTKQTDVYEAKKKHKVQAFFPITPFVPNSELRALYEQGVISWDSYATYALRNVSLPIEDKQKEAPPKDELLFEKPQPKEPKGGEKRKLEEVEDGASEEEDEKKKKKAKVEESKTPKVSKKED